MSLTPLPTSPQESAPLAHIFFLTGHEWSLTCSAKIWGEHCLPRCFLLYTKTSKFPSIAYLFIEIQRSGVSFKPVKKLSGVSPG